MDDPAPKEALPSFEIYPKAKRNVPADYAHSVLLLLKNDSESILLPCHFSNCLASISRPADFNSRIRKSSAKVITGRKRIEVFAVASKMFVIEVGDRKLTL